MATVYRIFEKAVNNPGDPGHETRVYVNEDDANEHVAENTDPLLDRWMEPLDDSPPPPIIDR